MIPPWSPHELVLQVGPGAFISHHVVAWGAAESPKCDAFRLNFCISRNLGEWETLQPQRASRLPCRTFRALGRYVVFFEMCIHVANDPRSPKTGAVFFTRRRVTGESGSFDSNRQMYDLLPSPNVGYPPLKPCCSIGGIWLYHIKCHFIDSC